MIKRLSLLLSLFAPLCVLAETVPALVIGGDTKVALQEIVSVKLDASNLYVLKTDGSTLTQPLATLTFGTTETGAGIRERLSESGQSDYIVYDLNGRMVKQGNAQHTQEVLSGLEAGTYIIRMGNQSFKVQTNGTVCNSWTYTPAVSTPFESLANVAASSDELCRLNSPALML